MAAFKKKAPRSQRDGRMEEWLQRKAKKTPHDVFLFYRLLRRSGTDRQTASRIALAKDGTAY